MTNNPIAISVIIPAKNEQARIGLCLEALVAQDYPHEFFEVVLVDNGSQDQTVAISLGFAEKVRLQVLPSQHGTISALRNLGVKASSGQLLAFLDADCLPNPDWLLKAANILATYPTAIVGAHYAIPTGSSWVGKTWNRYQEASKVGEVSHLPGGDLLLLREAFYRIGGFDETIQTNEDAELCERARAKGFSVLAFKELSVIHLGTPQTLANFYRKQRWHGTHVFAVFLRELPRFRNAKAVAFAVYFATWGAVLVVSMIVAGIFGKWMVPLFPIAAILGLPVGMALFFIAKQRARWVDTLPLAVLYLAYGLARAGCLLSRPKKTGAGLSTPTPRISGDLSS